MAVRRHAIVGLGSRAQLFARALAASPRAVLAAFCDSSETRMRVHNGWLGTDIPAYRPEDFTAMLAKERIDVVVVCTPDHTHADYVVAALEAGCDVVTEKPMTTDVEGARRVLAARRETGRSVRVAFNYRYNPVHRRVRELLAGGVIGEIGSVEFGWLLDTAHGADYFRRWHRDKAHSGGLLVHKSGHHFDLVNWWLGSGPETVFALGRLFFYGDKTGHRSDRFALDLDASPRLRALYRDAEREDGYVRNQDVFGPGVSIEDDLSVLVRFRGGAVLNYHLHAYSPREGYRVAFSGSEGRLELDVRENEYPAGAEPRPEPGRARLTVQRHWEPPETVLEVTLGTGHGGGDERMLAELLGDAAPDPLGCAADHDAGLQALLTGLAANRSLETGRPVAVTDLLGEIGEPA
ncbi:Gfo/Idh/MocA family protein [Amycolatopsis vancoresmycina]|uniref:Oxidoreductase domain-containing protein n=1 Tax=Amycolatopsis vancoresmycina DSM 44592 TaxID=1292037 RepID=R1FMQ6_9PSEU|nr:Gfo/Idh/MocA family oxidoreductase [Amycolatopsis vancoresmycina]EOD60807.1 oxidoreductase domain-containing protein [Amycolatopsis vancoresmycina DSM 44592]